MPMRRSPQYETAKLQNRNVFDTLVNLMGPPCLTDKSREGKFDGHGSPSLDLSKSSREVADGKFPTAV